MNKIKKLKEVKTAIDNVIVDLEIKIFVSKKTIKQKERNMESK